MSEITENSENIFDVENENKNENDINYLARKNPHFRDEMITFDEGPHIYTINGDSGFTSVTTWNHSHFEKFDADKIIGRMMSSKNWPKSKYFGKGVEEIKAMWDANRDSAAAAGTAMHYDIECYYNEMTVSNESVEYSYFNNFLAAMERGAFCDGGKYALKPYRTEWMVFHEELRLAGSIDMIYERDDGSGVLEIYDWKRCREITKSNAWNKCSSNPVIEHLPDTNYWHYCLQLNTYKAIIERKYGKKVGGMYLVCMHPENKRKNFERIKVVDLSEEIGELFAQRCDQLKHIEQT